MPRRFRALFRKLLAAIRGRWHGVVDRDTFLWWLVRSGGPRVLSGPFTGARYGTTSSGSTLLPKLLGTYERELHPVLARLAGGGFDTVVDVGCAEGYYLVGLGHACRRLGRPLPRLVGYETNKAAVALAVDLARLNAMVGQMACHAAPFAGQELEHGRVALICDIEGEEENLLDLATLPALARTEMLVEVHDEPGRERRLDLLLRRFAGSHVPHIIRRTERTLADFPPNIPGLLSTEWKLRLMDERRQFGNTWLHLVPQTNLLAKAAVE